MAVGANIRKKREEHGLTQVELSKRIGISQNHLSEVETGLKVPSLALSIKLADALVCTIDEIVGRRVS